MTEFSKRPIKKRGGTQKAASFSFDDVELSKKAQATLDSMKDNSSGVSPHSEDPVFKDASKLERVLIQYIIPHPDNSRYFPVDLLMSQKCIEELNDCVVCEKGVLENRLAKDNPRFNDVDDEIAEIKTLAQSIKANSLNQPIVVWMRNTTDYPIQTGHRRYYALRFLYGPDHYVKVKILANEPEHPAVLRFVENANRKNLRLYDAMDSYAKSLIDLEEALSGIEESAERKEYICGQLGIQHATYYRYEKLHKYLNIINPIIESGYFSGIKSSAAFIATVEKAHPENEIEGVSKFVSYVLEHKKIPDDISMIFKQNEDILTDKKVGRGRARKFYNFPKIPTSSPEVVKSFLSQDMTKLDTGVDWDKLDFSDPNALQAAIEKLFVSLLK